MNKTLGENMNVPFYKRNVCDSLTRTRLISAVKVQVEDFNIWTVIPECPDEIPGQVKDCTPWVRLSNKKWICIEHHGFKNECYKWLITQFEMLSILKNEFLFE